MSQVTLPAQGTGTSTPQVFTDLLGTLHAQYVKLLAGETGATFPVGGTPMGELVTAQRTCLFSDSLLVALDANFWTTTLASGGTTAIAAGQFQLLTNTTANGSAQIISLPLHRLLPGSYNQWDCWINLDSGAANNVRQWGPYSATDGLYFQLSGVSGFSSGARRSSVDTTVAAGSWNVNSTFVIDTNWHRYTIRWGALDAEWLIDGAVVHRIAGGGAANPLTDKLDLPSQLQNVNSAGQTLSTRLSARGLSAWRLGQPDKRPRQRHFSAITAATTLKSGAGTLKRVLINGNAAGTVTLADAIGSVASGVLTILNVTTGAGSGNSREVEVDFDFSTGLSFASSAANDVTVVWD